MRRLNRILLSSAAAGVLMTAGMAQGANLLSDGSFETLNIGTGNYTYPGLPFGTISPIGSTVAGAWTYNSAALVNASGGSAWYGGSGPSGKDGLQFAALQNTSTITQSFTASAATENLGWLSAGRACCSGDHQTYAVTLDGAPIGGNFSTVSGSDFGFNSLAIHGLHAGETHILGFRGLTANPDETAFLDNIILQNAAFPALPAPIMITRLSSASFDTDPGVPLDQHIIDNFTSGAAAGFSFTGGHIRPGSDGLDPGVSAPPPHDATDYETVRGGESAVLTSSHLLKSFSFYLGSPDSYNSVELLGPGFDQVLNGSAIWKSATDYGGDQSVGLRVRYDFGGNPVNKIIFGSSGNSFEFDTLAAGLGVPEPATWGLMIVGFGGVGAVLRNRRREALTAP
jgi:hypothetical protein